MGHITKLSLRQIFHANVIEENARIKLKFLGSYQFPPLLNEHAMRLLPSSDSPEFFKGYKLTSSWYQSKSKAVNEQHNLEKPR